MSAPILKDVSAVPIKGNINIAKVLRDIAEEIESGDIVCDHVTVIAGSEVYCLGLVSDSKSAESAIFDMTYGIHKIMYAVTSSEKE